MKIVLTKFEGNNFFDVHLEDSNGIMPKKYIGNYSLDSMDMNYVLDIFNIVKDVATLKDHIQRAIIKHLVGVNEEMVYVSKKAKLFEYKINKEREYRHLKVCR